MYVIAPPHKTGSEFVLNCSRDAVKYVILPDTFKPELGEQTVQLPKRGRLVPSSERLACSKVHSFCVEGWVEEVN
eukprot:g14197.t1